MTIFNLSATDLGSVGLMALIIVLMVGFVWASGVVRYIPNDRIGVVEMLWSLRGSVTGGFIALEGEAGFQPDVLRGGLHVLFPFKYRVHRVPLVTIGQGEIGYVFARDGATLPPTQTLGCCPPDCGFEDVAGFIRGGGQKGPQRKIVR